MTSTLDRFPRLRIWGPIVLGVLIVLIGTLAYLQTRHGFRHVVVPVVGLFLPGGLEVRDGFMDLPDTLELEGVRYVDRRAGVELFAERAFTVVSVSSLLGSGPPVVRVLEVKDATLALTLPRQEEEQPEADAVPDRARAVALLPLGVKQGRIDGLDLSIRRGDVTTTADRIVLAVEELATGEGSQVTLHTDWRYHDAGSGDSWSGSADAGVTVHQSLAGDALTWSGTASLDLREAPTLPPGGRAVTLEQAVEGSYDHPSGALRATSSLQVEQDGASLAAATADVSLSGEAGAPSLAASLTIERLTAAALNLGLAGRAEARFETADVKGRVDLRGTGDRLTVQSSVEGARIRLRLHGSRQATPPLAVSIQQAALVDRSAHMLTLETLDATVSDRARSVLVASLDRPLTMRLDRGLAASDATESGEEVAELSVTLHEIDVKEVRPWLALSGSHLLDEISGGRLQGRVAAIVRRQAETVELKGGLRVDQVVIKTPPSGDLLGPLRVEQELRATLTNLESLQVDEWNTTIAVKNKSVARMHAVGATRVRPEVAVETLVARLTLDELPGEMFNPLLAGTGGTRIARARLSGTGRVQVTQTQAAWDASFQGSHITFAIPDAPRPTAPVDVHLVQSGRLDRSSSVLTLPTLTMKVLEGRRVVLEGTLDQPLTLDLARDGDGDGATPTTQAEPVRFRLDIRRLTVEQLRPRLALLGSRALDGIQSGVLDGRLKIDVLGKGDSLDIAGQLDALDVRMRDTVSGPLTFRTSLEGTVAGAAHVTLKSWVVRVMAGTKELFLFQVNGSGDAARGAVDLTGHAFSVDVTNALHRVGWLSERGSRLRGGGELSARVQVVAQGADQPLAVTGEAKIAKLRTVITREKTLTRTMTARVDLAVNGARSLVSLNRVELGIQDNGRSEGSLTLTGTWPLADSERPRSRRDTIPPSGRLTVKASEMDAGPLVLLLDLLPGRAPGPLPLSIDATVSHDPALQVTQVRGRETLGPLSLAGRDAASDPTTVHLEHDLRIRGEDDLEVSRFILTSERRRSAPDRVDLKGRLRLGAKPRLELRGEVAQLDAAWYADLLSAPGDGEGAPGKTSNVTRTGDAQAKGHPAPLGVPLDLDIDTSIGTITYRTIVIGKGRLRGTGTGDRANLTLEPTGLAGGTVQGTLALAMKKGIPHLSWSAEGKTIDFGPIAQAFQSPDEPQIKGRASFTTSGEGRGQGAALKQSLAGTVVIDVIEGEFVKSKLLTYTARQTGVEQFEGMKFDSVHGEFKLADGWVHITRLAARGSGLAFNGTGKIGLEGQVDAVVTPGVMGQMAEHAKELCIAPLLRTVDDITQFPFAVKVSGTVTEPKFGMTVTTVGGVAKGVGALPLRMFETLRKCGNLPKVGKQIGEGGLEVLKGAGRLFEGLLGGSKKKEEKTPQPAK